MTRDPSHMEQVERWARYVRDNPDSWKKFHTSFINGIFDKAQSFVSDLSRKDHGDEKIIELYGIKNVSGYKQLLGKKKRYQ